MAAHAHGMTLAPSLNHPRPCHTKEHIERKMILILIFISNNKSGEQLPG
jgi:hypothetical protein